jgi:hypothetical protein
VDARRLSISHPFCSSLCLACAPVKSSVKE